MRPSTIAIDGPAASGKSTIGYLLATRLGYLYVDTGAMYRAATRAVLEENISTDDERAATELVRRLNIDISTPEVDDGRRYTVRVDGEDVTWELRFPQLERFLSQISAYPGVRQALTSQQRRIASRGDVVMVGRDIGTVVIPNADLKVYLDASPEVRARRRYLELVERGESADYDDILQGMERRDRIDSSREVAPLKPASDAVIVNTDNLSVAGVLEEVERIVAAESGTSADRSYSKETGKR